MPNLLTTRPPRTLLFCIFVDFKLFSIKTAMFVLFFIVFFTTVPVYSYSAGDVLKLFFFFRIPESQSRGEWGWGWFAFRRERAFIQ